MELIFAVHLNGPVVCRCFPDLEGDGAGGLDTLDCGVSDCWGYLSGRDLLGGALHQKGFSFVLIIWGVWRLCFCGCVVCGLCVCLFFFQVEGFFSLPFFAFAQELLTNLICPKLLFSVSRVDHAPQMRN